MPTSPTRAAGSCSATVPSRRRPSVVSRTTLSGTYSVTVGSSAERTETCQTTFGSTSGRSRAGSAPGTRPSSPVAHAAPAAAIRADSGATWPMPSHGSTSSIVGKSVSVPKPRTIGFRVSTRRVAEQCRALPLRVRLVEGRLHRDPEGVVDGGAHVQRLESRRSRVGREDDLVIGLRLVGVEVGGVEDALVLVEQDLVLGFRGRRLDQGRDLERQHRDVPADPERHRPGVHRAALDDRGRRRRRAGGREARPGRWPGEVGTARAGAAGAATAGSGPGSG